MIDKPPHAAPAMGRVLLDFLRIGAIGFGGGMAVIALMRREIVEKRKLLSESEFLHGVALGQMLGSFAVNVACFVGFRLFGVVGAMLASAAFLLPSVAIVTALSHFYFRYHAIPALDGAVAGLGPIVIALIVDAGWSVARSVVRSRWGLLTSAGALVAGMLKVNAAWIILAAGAVGLARAARPGGKAAQCGWFGFLTAATPASPLALLSLTFFKIGLVFFGGGFVLIPMLHQRLVDDLGWLTTREFMDGVAISNLTPGPIAVLSTFAGYRIAGVAGALVATVALLLPGVLLMALLSRQYERHGGNEYARAFLAGLNPAVAGLILAAAALLGRAALVSWREWVVAALALIALRRLRWPPAAALACGAAAGYFRLLP